MVGVRVPCGCTRSRFMLPALSSRFKRMEPKRHRRGNPLHGLHFLGDAARIALLVMLVLSLNNIFCYKCN